MPVCPSDKSSSKMKKSTERWWNGIDRGNGSTGTETSVTATLSTANVTWTDLGLNLGPKTKLNLHYKKSYGSCLTENTLCFHYIHQTTHVGEMMVVYLGNSRPHKHAARAKL